MGDQMVDSSIMGINLQVRNLENHIIQALNEFNLPIEVKRVVLQGILEKIVNEANAVTREELEDFNKRVEEIKNEKIKSLEEAREVDE